MVIIQKNVNRFKKRKNKTRYSGLAMIAVLIIAVPVTAFCAEDVAVENRTGVENRSVSVDISASSEGFSAILYNNSNGLPTSEANAIAETSDGFIWIGSYAGLIRYDGNTFERMDSTGGLTSIKCLYVDDNDRLWIGTNDNGVAVMKQGELRQWGKLDGMKSAHIRAITADRNGTVYIATTCGIAMIDKDYSLSLMEEDAVSEADMRDLRIGRDGVIYGITDAGDLIIIQDKKLLNYIRVEDSPIQGVGSILPDPAEPGKIYVEGGDFGLYHVDVKDGFTVLEEIGHEPLKYISSMEYIDGNIWILATNGIGVMEGTGFHLVEDLPMNNNVCQVMTDYLGNLWFASTRQGVMKVVPNQFSDVLKCYDLPEMVVNSTCMYDGKLFVGSDAGLFVLDEEKGVLTELPLTKAKTVSGVGLGTEDLIAYLKESRIRSIIRDSRDRLWISTWRANGLLRYDHGELTAFTKEDGLFSESIRAVSECEDGTILVALEGGVNVIRDDSIIASYGSEDGIVNTASLSVCEGINGDIVLGSNGGGLYIINEKEVKNIDVEDGLPSDIVMRVKRDQEQDLVWIVTSSAIAYMTSDYRVTTIQKFPYPNNFDLYKTSNEDIWVLASNGIYVVPSAELVANGDINPIFYGIDSGLPCIATANSYSELTAEGELYIAGSTGVCKVNVEKPFENVDDLKAAVPFVDVDGRRLYPDGDGNFTIPTKTHKLTVYSFVYNYSLSSPQVSWQLEGFEDENSPVSRSMLAPVDYTNLKGGTYRFVLHLMDSMGSNNKEVSVKIVKEKAFYEHIWFNILVILLIIICIEECVRLYFRNKTRAMERKQQETRTLVREITEAFAKVIDMKDQYTNGHSFRVAKFTAMLAKELGYDDETVEKYYRIALLHDVGKIGIPPDVLNKPGKLTDEEFEIIKSHTTKGYDALKEIKIMPELAVGAQSHHERPDGKGYPNHLKGGEIPRVAQIIAVADCFDAMYSNRPYRNRMNFDKAISIIKEVRGTQLTEDVVDAFLRLVEKGYFRAADDNGGGSTEDISNIRADHEKKHE